MLSDIEIAQSTEIKDITTILGDEYKDMIEPYGKDMAKISYTYIDNEKVKNNNLILVTSITPTNAGIGKTTVSIGLNDALNYIGKKSIAVLREPSLGPCFGMKGGACGGGYSQVIPMEKINLHFTGDFHAITAANNMLAAALDNYLYQNKLGDSVKQILFKRCLDINDRSLRNIHYKIRNSDTNEITTGFNITPASEMMAIFCLANNIENLRNRIDNILLAELIDNTYIYAKDLNITGSIVALLSEAFKPNLVQSLEHNPVIIHGGPFANIAHGCNSIVATKLGLSLREYVVTEAGFGADLGAQKFWDIKCQIAGLTPACVVMVVTIKGLKRFTGDINDGFKNMLGHYLALTKLGHKVIITYNQHSDDSPEDIDKLKTYCFERSIKCVENTCFVNGGRGAVRLARVVVSQIEDEKHPEVKHTYYPFDTLDNKIKKILINSYRYTEPNIIFKDDEVKEKFNKVLNNIQYASYLVCIAKTQYSMTDDPTIVPITKDDNQDFMITDIEVNNGAGFIVVSAGNMMRMPGLPKEPAATKIDFIDNKIIGLS